MEKKMGKIKRICESCKKEFWPVFSRTKTCSSECNKIRVKKAFGVGKSFIDIPSGTVGAISEIEVSSYLLKNGYSVFRALSPCCFCDLIAVKEKTIRRIEARTGYITNANKVMFPQKTHGEIDCFGIYFPKTNEIKFYDLLFKEINI